MDETPTAGDSTQSSSAGSATTTTAPVVASTSRADTASTQATQPTPSGKQQAAAQATPAAAPLATSSSSNYKTRSTTKRATADGHGGASSGTRISIGSPALLFPQLHSPGGSGQMLSHLRKEIREGREYQAQVESVCELEQRRSKQLLDESLKREEIEEGEEGRGEEKKIKEEEQEAWQQEEWKDERDVCLWKPEWEHLDDKALMAYCCRANQLCGIGLDRALFILQRSNYDLKTAEKKLRTRQPVTSAAMFNDDEQYTFRCAISKYGKKFAKIHQMIPHKSMATLVEFYYLTKKKQHFKSLMESSCGRWENFAQLVCEDSSDEESDDDQNVQPSKPTVLQKQDGYVCENCRQVVKRVYMVNELEVCTTCKLYFKATNQHRPCPQNVEERRPHLNCPPDMQKIADDFVEFAQPVDVSGATYEDLDDAGEVQIACPTVTRCQLEIRKTRNDLERMQCEARQAESTAGEELRRLGAAHEVLQSLEEARALLKRTACVVGGAQQVGATQPPVAASGGGNLTANNTHNGQLPQLGGANAAVATGATSGSQRAARLNYTWNTYEKEACFFALVRFGVSDFSIAASICNKTVDMVRHFYMENKEYIDEALAQHSNFEQERAQELNWAEELHQIRKEQMGGFGIGGREEEEEDEGEALEYLLE